MSEWREVALGDVCRRVTDGDWIETKDQGGADYRLLQVSNIGLGTFRETGKFRYVTSETFQRLRCTEVLPGMVLVARMPDPVGRCWYVKELRHPAITAVDVAILDPDPRQLDGRYCAYALNSPAQLAEWAAAAGGTTRMRITRRQIASAQLRLPPLATQKGIAAVLGSIDDLIENNRRRVEVLEEMARAIYREWFVRFRYPGHEDVPLVDSPLGPIPDGWKVSTCGDELTVIGGGTPSKKSPVFWDGGTIPWFTPSDLTKSKQRYASAPELNITSEGLARSSARLFPKGSVLMTSRATLGVLAIATDDSTTNQGFIVIPPDDRWSPSFIYEWLDLRADALASVATGATFKEITKGAFKRVPFVVPAQHLLDAHRALIEPIESQIRVLEEQGCLLASLRDLLLPKLVTGQIDVSHLDLDALAEAATA